MIPFICLDRDGTINVDDNYYLGSSEHWQEQVEILEGVIEGIRLLHTINAKIVILTNQSGVALLDLPLLTEERMHEVNRHICELLLRQDAKVHAYHCCPYVDAVYVEKAIHKGRRVDPAYVVDNHPDLKPRPGMVYKAMRDLGIKKEECRVFAIGDRLSDVQMGINAGGVGILVPGPKTGDIEKVKDMGNAYIAENFLEAARLVIAMSAQAGCGTQTDSHEDIL